MKNKKKWPSFNKSQVPETIEKVFCTKTNFLSVMIGVTSPIASKIDATKSRINNVTFSVSFFKFYKL